MRMRRFGRTGLSISELTLGSSTLRADTIVRALELGINSFDIDGGDQTAAALLGEVLRKQRAAHRVNILARMASQARFDLPSPHILVDQAYPGAQLRAQTEALLKTLGVERLAVQQLHAWCPEWLHEGDWLETGARLREEGKIAGIGISLFDHDVEAGAEAIASGAIDAVQAMFNIFDPAAALLMPLCQQHDVAMIARAPLYYGALAEPDLAFVEGDWRQSYFYEAHRAETRERVGALARVAELPADALRFSLSHPAVSTVAIGMRTPGQVEANVAAAARGALSADRLAALAGHRWLV